ncbi:MAG UNVERIFIED_CONTAM: thioredoxin domain-containing protein [Planctomycetaceae bacterium]
MHAHNPIQWYPWGPEAFEKGAVGRQARVSVGGIQQLRPAPRDGAGGVSRTEKIAAYMNEKYVCIKVDREERPDVDDIYMTSPDRLPAGGRQSCGVAAGRCRRSSTARAIRLRVPRTLPPEDTPDGRTGISDGC